MSEREDERDRTVDTEATREQPVSRTAPRAPVKALLTDGPMRGKPVEIELVEGRPPMTIDLQDEKDGTLRYCLSELSQEGMAATYTFLYAV